MDPDAAPLEEAEEGVAVTVNASYPSPSFMGSGASSLTACPQENEPVNERFPCNASCTPANHMSTPTQKPLLDTGGSHCLLPYSTLSKENAEQAKKIHLRVASGKPERAMMYQGVIYASVERSLLNVGQLRDALGLSWDDILHSEVAQDLGCHPCTRNVQTKRGKA